MAADGDDGQPIALLTAMTSEMKPLARALSLRRATLGGIRVATGTYRGRALVARVVGIGPAMARRNTEQLLDALPPGRVLLAGVSGGVAATLAIGRVLAPAVVVDQAGGERFTPSRTGPLGPTGTLLTCTTLQVGPDVLGALRVDGVTAVDMESAAVAAVCAARGVPWTVYRTISDRLQDDLVDESILGLTRPDGSTNLPAVLRLIARHPADLRRLAAIGRDTTVALRALRSAVLDDVSA